MIGYNSSIKTVSQRIFCIDCALKYL